jgi:fructan beta-fructosidase
MSLKRASLAKANQWLAEKNVAGGLWEIEAEVAVPDGNQEFGMNLFKGNQQATVLRCNPASLSISLDRTHSGRTDFHSKFSGSYEGPLRIESKTLRLHLLVDTSSIELFANDGETVLTMLVFAGATSQPLEFWSTGPSLNIKRLDVWKLKSAWQ